MAWDLLVDRAHLDRTEVVEVPTPEPDDGEVLLRVDRVGMTANNVTYAVMGDTMGYWGFFPAEDLDGVPRGRVPLWGFAEVERSTVPEVAEGTRLYGYLPTSSHLVVRPDRIDAHGFRDASPHRLHLPSAYHKFVTTTADPAYDADQEDLQVLYRPLFVTSFMLADFLLDHDLFGAEVAVLSSASAKTTYGAAFLLGDAVHRVGLTSAANRDFTESLGCYDEVLTYDEVDRLAARPTVYVDVAGNAALRRRVHEQVRPVHSAVVGAAHHDAAPDPGDEELPGARPAFFFAPDQMRKRRTDWGPHGVEEGHAEAWSRFAPVVADWVDVQVGHGPDGLQAAWLETLAGATPPRTGLVVQL
ncbi:MAG: DUF2855 family protein [Microthrixaceae bacterium]